MKIIGRVIFIKITHSETIISYIKNSKIYYYRWIIQNTTIYLKLVDVL